MKNKIELPYFDHLLDALKDDPIVEKSFGRHVHWGYWEQPDQALLTADDFAAAADSLTRMVCCAAHISHSQKVLDVGCGFGGTIAYLNENFRNMQLLGLNLDERQLARARDTVKANAENSVQFQQGNACALPFSDNSFDVVLAVECIFHFPDRHVFFQEARRVLKPNGFLALSDFVPTHLILPLTKIPWPEPLNIGFYGKCNVQYTAEKYRKLAEQSGFSVQSEQDITAQTLPTYSYLRSLGRKTAFSNTAAVLETLTLEFISRLRLMKYLIYTFRKT